MSGHPLAIVPEAGFDGEAGDGLPAVLDPDAGRDSAEVGRRIAQRLEQISKAVVQVNQGSLYPALHRLEQKGWLKAEWKQSETGREAKFYSLTRSGQKQLRIEKDSWARLTGAVQLIFDEGVVQ